MPRNAFGILVAVAVTAISTACVPVSNDGGNDNATGGTQPIFSATYRTDFSVVRDCRFGIEHGGVMFRVFANEIAREAYLANQNPLPVGSILIKEEFNGVDCADDSQLFQWRVMRKESPGFDSDDSDWHWQRVVTERRVVEDTKATCISCHRAPACIERDYMCTEP